MENGWQTVELGKVMQLEIDAVPVDSQSEFQMAGVYSFARGLFKRSALPNTQTTYKFFHRLHKDMFVISVPKGWEGALARVTENFDGLFLSPVFPTFRANPKELDIQYFEWYCRQSKIWDELRRKSRGIGARRESISAEQFLSLQIPIPPLDEQRRIVKQIEALAVKIAKARLLREKSIEEINAFWKSLLSKTFSPYKSIQSTVEDSCEVIIDNLHATPRYDGNQFHCVRSQDIGWGTMNYSTMLKTSEEEFLERIRRGEPRKDDIVFVREGDIGRCAVLDGAHRLSLGQRVMMLRPDTSKIIPNFMMYQLMSSPVLVDQLLSGKKGTTSHHLNISHFRKVIINVPPLDEQRRIVAYLDSVQARLASLRQLQSETQEELGALLPSVLDRAFKGEL